jgi:uracil phosphoribosyltransferase
MRTVSVAVTISVSVCLFSVAATISSATTSRADWVFCADRVIRLIVEYSLNFLPVSPRTVTTPVDGALLHGSSFAGKIVGVSVIRAGEAMENALRSCCRNVRIGKMLIQRDEETAEPAFYMARLPSDIAGRHVLLLDPMLATGGSALCAIGKLVEAGVDEGKIVFVTVVAAPEGVRRVLGTYPRVCLCAAQVAEGLNGRSYIKRSVGDFGDRYFTE